MPAEQAGVVGGAPEQPPNPPPPPDPPPPPLCGTQTDAFGAGVSPAPQFVGCAVPPGQIVPVE